LLYGDYLEAEFLLKYEELLEVLLSDFLYGDPLLGGHADSFELLILNNVLKWEHNPRDSEHLTGSCEVGEVGYLLKESGYNDYLAVLLLANLNLVRAQQ
jgi:hypothetical protein